MDTELKWAATFMTAAAVTLVIIAGALTALEQSRCDFADVKPSFHSQTLASEKE